jgi:hypothetical protein
LSAIHGRKKEIRTSTAPEMAMIWPHIFDFEAGSATVAAPVDDISAS